MILTFWLFFALQNIDLHALTGWIPERVSIQSGSVHFNKDKEFRRISSRFHRGHCLVTVATGQLAEDQATRAGLVPTHAYALLDIREIDVSFALQQPRRNSPLIHMTSSLSVR